MKILKHGDLKPRKFTCKTCGCEFVAEIGEYEVNRDIFQPNKEVAYNIACPDCAKIIFAKEYEAPLYNEESNSTLNDKLDRIIDNFLDYLDEEVHPNCDYYIYTHLHNILTDLSAWQEEYENESNINN